MSEKRTRDRLTCPYKLGAIGPTMVARPSGKPAPVDVMRMIAHVGGLEIPAREAVRLARGDKPIMLMELKRPLAAGDAIDLTLRFERVGPIDIHVPVGDAAG